MMIVGMEQLATVETTKTEKEETEEQEGVEEEGRVAWEFLTN
jgi:hypothetical protein